MVGQDGVHRRYVAMQRLKPTPRQCAQLAGATGKGIQTIGRLYDGRDVLMSTYIAVAAAARELGIPEPPEPSTDEVSETGN